MAVEPFNIIVGSPFEVWTAPVGTAFPVINVAPGVGWVKLGTNQSAEYNDDGVAISHEQEIEMHRFLGSTGARKASRTEENLRIELTVHDLTLETYATALGVDVTTAAGPPATKEVNLWRGFDVNQFALLVRGASPYMDGSMQYEVPVVIVDGEPEVVYSKSEPAGLLFSFVALEDPNAATPEERYGRLIAQTA
jgi:hypothetical protein